jgi:hypothetical protein
MEQFWAYHAYRLAVLSGSEVFLLPMSGFSDLNYAASLLSKTDECRPKQLAEFQTHLRGRLTFGSSASWAAEQVVIPVSLRQ